MKAVLGFSKLSPIVFTQTHRAFLSKQGWRSTVFERGRIYKKPTVFLFLSMAEFLTHAPSLARLPCVAVIFDCSERLLELQNLVWLDKKAADRADVQAALIAAMAEPEGFAVVLKKKNHIRAVTEKNKTDGFMHEYNTLLYSITNKDLREHVKFQVVSYLGGYSSLRQFREAMNEQMPKRGKAKETVEAFIKLMAAPPLAALQAAIKGTRGRKQTTVEEQAKKHRAQAYDMRYMLAAIENYRNEGRLK